MGHKLLLTLTVPHKNYAQTVATLQALTGITHPQKISTYTLVTRPRNVFKPKFEPGKVNQIEQYYMRCSTVWDDDASRDLDLSQPVLEDLMILVDRLFSGKEVKNWTLHVLDIPKASAGSVSAFNFYESTLVHHHAEGSLRCVEEPVEESKEAVKLEDDGLVELMEIDGEPKTEEIKQEPTPATPKKDSFLIFLEELGYDVVNQYWIRGARFIHGDIVIELYKMFIRDDEVPADANGKLKLKLIDSTNTFQVQCFVTFPRNASVDAISQGSRDLVKLKGTLQNLIDLSVPDRMHMDSRVPRE